MTNIHFLQILLLRSADELPISYFQWHVSECMDYTLGIQICEQKVERLVYMGLISDLSCSDHEDPCEWNGVHCQEGLPHTVNWQSKIHLRIKTIDWLPGCLERVHFQDIRIGTTINTRFLPRDLWYCNMCKCGLTGTLDLSTLPMEIEEIHFRSNKLTGGLNLCQLPSSLRVADLALNPFGGVRLLNAKLPVKLIAIHIFSLHQELSIKCIDSRKRDKRIRKTMRAVASDARKEMLFGEDNK